ncbi:MAG: LamG domain-containing protein, partial [Verrucomicrobia bacterium]|nr:LamG domain-containing protein [Verrucomicrobiota bacterium]
GVRNWGGRGAAEVRVNGRKVSEMRQGAFVDTDGTDTMILWVELETSAPAEFTIGGARPSPDYVATPYLVELTSALAKPVERPSPRPQPIRPQPIPRPREVIAEGEPVIAWNPSKEFHGKTVVEFDQIAKLRVAQSMTWSAWFRTGQGGTIMALTGAGDQWVHGGVSLFVQGHRLVLDVGWQGAYRGPENIADDKWHHVAVTQAEKAIHFYVDGKYQHSYACPIDLRNPALERLKIGFTNDNFPKPSYFTGHLRDVRVYDYAMTDEQLLEVIEEEP